MKGTILKQLQNQYRLKRISTKDLPDRTYKSIQQLCIIFYRCFFYSELKIIPKNPLLLFNQQASHIQHREQHLLHQQNPDNQDKVQISKKSLLAQQMMTQKYQQLFINLQNKKSYIMDYIGCVICLLGDHILLQENEQNSYKCQNATDTQNRSSTENTFALFFNKLTQLKMELKQYLYVMFIKLTLNIVVSLESVQCIFKKFIKSPMKSTSFNFNAKMKFINEWQVIKKNMKNSKNLVGQNRFAKSKRNIMHNNSYVTQLKSILKQAQKQVKNQRQREMETDVPSNTDYIISNQSSDKDINSNVSSFMASNSVSYRSSRKNSILVSSKQGALGIGKITIRLKKLTNFQTRTDRYQKQLNQSLVSPKLFQQNMSKQLKENNQILEQDRSLVYWEKYVKKLKNNCLRKNENTIQKLNKSQFLPSIASTSSRGHYQDKERIYLQRDSKILTTREDKGRIIDNENKNSSIKDTKQDNNKQKISKSQLFVVNQKNIFLNTISQNSLIQSTNSLFKTSRSIKSNNPNQHYIAPTIKNIDTVSQNQNLHQLQNQNYTTRIDIPKNKRNKYCLKNSKLDRSRIGTQNICPQISQILHKNPRKLRKQMDKFMTQIQNKQY